jgi:hypothetical protein
MVNFDQLKDHIATTICEDQRERLEKQESANRPSNRECHHYADARPRPGDSDVCRDIHTMSFAVTGWLCLQPESLKCSLAVSI